VRAWGRYTDIRELRQAEVEHLHGAVFAHLDVRRFQIAMDDALFVRGFERGGDLPRDRERVVGRNWPSRDALGERRPFDELHHERFGPRLPCACRRGRIFEPVDGGDVRVIERRKNFSFALKTRKAIGIGRQRRGKHFDGDVPLQSRICRAVNLTHAAGAKRRHDLIRAQPGAGRHGHEQILDWLMEGRSTDPARYSAALQSRQRPQRPRATRARRKTAV
jgi:hypothetical protein